MIKVGDKFIVEIGQVISGRYIGDGGADNALYLIKGFNSLVFDENGFSKLDKYEESPFTQEDCDRARSEGYQEGLNDAWEAARKLAENVPTTNQEIFDYQVIGYLEDVLEKCTAEEAIEKIKVYEEQKAEDELQKAKETMKEILDNSQTRNEFLSKVLKMPEIVELIEKMEVK